MRRALIAIGFLGLAACEPSKEQLMAEVAVSELKSELRDPGSLQLTETKVAMAKGWGAICGRYNAANGFGGMAGSQRFVRVFNAEELSSLKREDGKARGPLFRALQTSYYYDDREQADAPIEDRKERDRGLFMEPTNPILTIRYTANHCVLGAEPIEITP